MKAGRKATKLTRFDSFIELLLKLVGCRVWKHISIIAGELSHLLLKLIHLLAKTKFLTSPIFVLFLNKLVYSIVQHLSRLLHYKLHCFLYLMMKFVFCIVDFERTAHCFERVHTAFKNRILRSHRLVLFAFVVNHSILLFLSGSRS